MIFTHVRAQGYVSRKGLVNVPPSIWALMVPCGTMARKK